MLKLYKGITPNTNNLHYYFTDFDDYLTELGTPFMQFELDNYLINQNQAIVNIPEADAIDITYMIEQRDAYYRCYNVDFVNYQTNGAVFNLSVDYWASYIAKASIDKIRVTRCNRNVGIGVYDSIAVTKGNGIKQVIGESYDAGTIIFTALVTVSSGNLNTPATTMVKNYAVKLGSLDVKSETSQQQVGDEFDTFFKMVNLVSGINAVKGMGGINSDLNATLLHVYCADDKVIDSACKIISHLPVFKATTKDFGGVVFDITPNYELAPHEFNYEREIAIDVNNEYYVGTKHYGLKLTRTTESTIKVNYNFLYKNDSVQVLVKQGAQSLDITNAFEFGVATGGGTMSTQEKIAKGIGVIGSFAGGGNAIAKGEIMSGVLNITSAINSILPQSNGGYIGGGDGLSEHTHIVNGALYHDNWEYLTRYESCDDEKAQARLFGATFNQQIASLADLTSYALLGEGTLTDTYIKCDCCVNNIPTLAQNYITSKLNSGVYIKIL